MIILTCFIAYRIEKWREIQRDAMFKIRWWVIGITVGRHSLKISWKGSTTRVRGPAHWLGKPSKCHRCATWTCSWCCTIASLTKSLSTTASNLTMCSTPSRRQWFIFKKSLKMEAWETTNSSQTMTTSTWSASLGRRLSQNYFPSRIRRSRSRIFRWQLLREESSWRWSLLRLMVCIRTCKITQTSPTKSAQIDPCCTSAYRKCRSPLTSHPAQSTRTRQISMCSRLSGPPRAEPRRDKLRNSFFHLKVKEATTI